MRAHFSPVNPQDFTYRLEIEMTLDEWEQVMKQLPSAHPSWKMGAAIQELVCHARKHFDPSGEDRDV